MARMRQAFIALLITSNALAVDLEAMKRQAHQAFERELGQVDPDAIVVDLSAKDCLRTGYRRSTRTVVFCPSARVINAGLESPDVIYHEFFHALFCSAYPAKCLTDDFDHAHEALADAFAYRLNPDLAFGENFYRDRTHVRPYQTDWRPGLVRSEHERGSALAWSIIQSGASLEHFLGLFRGQVEAEVNVRVHGATYSHLNRYRLAAGVVLVFDFEFDPAAGVRQIEWITQEGLEVTNEGFRTKLRRVGRVSAGKSTVRFLSNDRRELGRWTFYFGDQI